MKLLSLAGGNWIKPDFPEEKKGETRQTQVNDLMHG